MNGLIQLWRVACYEGFDALRSRRALVVLLLYLLAAVCTMNGSISALQRMEDELAAALKLPQTEHTGVISTTLWQSKPFQRMMRQATGNDAALQDLTGQHPAELIYAWLVFFYTPLLVVLVSGNRMAEDLGSGAVRYMVLRTSRACWTFGKFLGQALLIGLAFSLSALGAYVVARFRLGWSGTPDLFLHLILWSLRAWVFSIPYLGLALGLSLLTRSPSKALVLGMLAITVCFILSTILKHFGSDTGWRAWLAYADPLLPESHKMDLWRSHAAPFASGAAHQLTLGVCYLLAGYTRFRSRDI